MTTRYVPGVYAKQFRRLPKATRDSINQQANQRFFDETNVRRKLDPRRDQVLCWRWLEIRDEVMKERANPRAKSPHVVAQAATRVGQAVKAGAGMYADFAKSFSQTAEAPWMEVARQERRLGIAETPGKPATKKIMTYSLTCPHLYSTANKTKYMESNGDEGFKWCSTFVNWCMAQVGIEGTRNALAMSWKNWGVPVDGPCYGAIIVLKTSSWNHVAFVDEVDGQFKMLGGNQKPEHGKGPDCVSYQRINPSSVVAYRMPRTS